MAHESGQPFYQGDAFQDAVRGLYWLPESHETLSDRYVARAEAFLEVSAAIRESMGIESTGELALGIMQQIGYGLAVTYEAGFGLHGSDEELLRTMHIEGNFKKPSNASNDNEEMVWMPTSDEGYRAMLPVLRLIASLCLEDKKPAYYADLNGRSAEIMDPPGTAYNKYGELVYPAIT